MNLCALCIKVIEDNLFMCSTNLVFFRNKKNIELVSEDSRWMSSYLALLHLIGTSRFNKLWVFLKSYQMLCVFFCVYIFKCGFFHGWTLRMHAKHIDIDLVNLHICFFETQTVYKGEEKAKRLFCKNEIRSTCDGDFSCLFQTGFDVLLLWWSDILTVD